jgi:hypothetical protein
VKLKGRDAAKAAVAAVAAVEKKETKVSRVRKRVGTAVECIVSSKRKKAGRQRSRYGDVKQSCTRPRTLSEGLEMYSRGREKGNRQRSLTNNKLTSLERSLGSTSIYASLVTPSSLTPTTARPCSSLEYLCN